MFVVTIKVKNQALSNVLTILRRLMSSAESGVDLDQSPDVLATADDQGNTVVHWAARMGCCRTLRRALATTVVSVPNQFGVTPLHVAADRGIRDEVEVAVLCYPVVGIGSTTRPRC